MDVSVSQWLNCHPCFGRLVMSALGLKARMDSLICVLCCLNTMDSSDSPLVQHQLTPHTVEEEHAIQTDLFIYTRSHKRNIFQVIAKKQVSKYTHTFPEVGVDIDRFKLEMKMRQ